MKHAFLYMVKENDGLIKYKVVISRFTDFSDGRTEWMSNPELPPIEYRSDGSYGSWRLSIDITDSVHTFDSFQDASTFLAMHYATQVMGKKDDEWK